MLRKKISWLIMMLVMVTAISGCGVIFSRTTKSVIRTEDQGATIQLVCGDDTLSGTDSLKVKLKNFRTDYFVNVTRPDLKPLVMPLIRSRDNDARIIDFAIPLAADVYVVYLLTDSDSTNDNVPIAPIIIGTAGWGLGLLSPPRLYEKEFSVSQLYSYPYDYDSTANTYIENVSILNSELDFRLSTFLSFKKYEKGKPLDEETSPNILTTGDNDLRDFLSEDLRNWGYTDDPSPAEFSGIYILSCKITQLYFDKVGDWYQVYVSTQWKLHNRLSDMDAQTFYPEGYSNWMKLKSPGNYSEGLKDAMENTLIKLMSDETVEKMLRVE